MMKCVTILVASLLLIVAVCAHRIDLDDGGYIETREYKFPGQTTEVVWMDTLMIVVNHNHVFASRNHGKTFESFTSDAKEFKGPTSRGLVSKVFVPKVPGQTKILIRNSNQKTYVFETKSGEVGVLYPIQLDDIPEKDSMSIYTKQITNNTRRPYGADWFELGNIAFDDIMFHPTDPTIAIGIKTAPDCPSFYAALCDNYIWMTGGDPKYPSKRPYHKWRYMDINAWPVEAFFLNDAAATATEKRLKKYGILVGDKTKYNTQREFFAMSRCNPMTQLNGTLLRYEDVNDASFGAVLLKDIVVHERSGIFDFFGGYKAKDPKKEMTAQNTVPVLYHTENNFGTTQAARFPKNIFLHGSHHTLSGEEAGYTVLDTKDTAFVNVFRGDSKHQQVWGHTYQSGAGGERYTISLPYNRRVFHMGRNAVDFHRVKGIDGIIIANRVKNPNDNNCRMCYTEVECEKYCEFESVITYDNGKEWNLINPPKDAECFGKQENGGDDYGDEDDQKNKKVTATSKCALHFHSYTSQSRLPISSIYSSKFTPGLIMATGNVGKTLNMERAGDRFVFISRDAGVTWRKVSEKQSLYGTTDYGGVVFQAPLASKTNSLQFSFDESKSWQTVRVVKDPYFFLEFIPVPHRPNAHHVTFMAVDYDSSVDVAVYVDLHHAKTRTCKNLDKPNTEDSDFTTFVPTTASDGCLMGSHIKYVTKKYGKSCWIHVDAHVVDPDSTIPRGPYLLPTQSTPCKCDYDDYECDIGFEAERSGKCKNVTTSYKLDCFNGQKRVSQGYRRMVDTNCEGGLDLDVKLVNDSVCDYTKRHTSSKGKGVSVGRFFLIVFAVAAVSGVLVGAYRSSESIRDEVDDLFDAIKKKIGFGKSEHYSVLQAVETDDDLPTPTAATIQQPASGSGVQMDNIGDDLEDLDDLS